MSIILRVGAVKPLRGQETQYGSGDEASVSYTDADVLDIPLPEHTYQRPLPSVLSQPQSNTSYFGLPYQDHNYGMPPLPSPPRPATPDPPSPLQVNGVVQMEEEVKTSPLVSVVEEVVEDSITRCICGYLHDDGYMICCDKCSVWQHIDCMGVDRNNIPDNYFCELCQPRVLDAVRAKALQKKKREELAARNVLSDSSATDTDPEEAANALASMVKKLPVTKRKGLKQKRNTKTKDKPPLKLKIGKPDLTKKLKKPGKKEKENIKAIKPKKVFKPGVRKLKEIKSRPLMVAEQINTDPWDSSASPWVDAYEFVQENMYSKDVNVLCCDTIRLFQSGEIPLFLPHQLQAQLVCVADVKKNRKGLKAADQILAGQSIIEYKGRVMLKDEYNQQYALYKPAAVLQPFVLFHTKSDIIFCVDATTCGNESRFIRRSCAPNAEVHLQYREKKVHFVIHAEKDIGSGVEVTIPFDYDYHNSSTCIECACLRNNCVISRFWKKKKKLQQKEFTGKRRRQSSGDAKKVQDQLQTLPSPQGSPRKVTSPGKVPDAKHSSSSPIKMGSPIRLSVSTLLAASALLEAQSEVSTEPTQSTCDSLRGSAPVAKAATSPLPKSATSLRRGSKASDVVKDEKSNLAPISVPHPKEKATKVKEAKHKVKENKDVHVQPPVEVKKERRLSSRRQSQEEVTEDIPPVKEEIALMQESDKEDAAAAERYKKMTREERKLDAIMKAFEKMEKREERRKEAVARGEGTTAKKVPELKGRRKDDPDDTTSRTRSVSQDGPVEDDVKVEVEEPQGKPSAGSDEVKQEPSSMAPLPHQLVDSPVKEAKPMKEEPPTSQTQRLPRKLGKRKRRRSRVQTAPPTTDSLPQSQDESSSNSTIAQIPPYIPPAPASAPLPSSGNISEADGEEFKYIKSKKHLFNEWSHKHEDESHKQEEMFVECLPSPRVNAMDHLQRRNSHSAGCNKMMESGGGFAKKRWLRQAMHEEPVPITFNHSLSVSTDIGSASPINGSISPSNGVSLASPGASSPIDFVTPLKKRRLMRESLSNEGNGPLHSPGQGVLAENAVDVGPKSNGLKSFIPAHRHSVDDRLLLHKNYPHQNGFRETSAHNTGLFKKAVTPSSVSVCLKFDSVQSKSEDMEATPAILTNGMNHKVSEIEIATSSSSHLVNGFSSSDCITSVSLSPSRSTQVISLRAPYERMEIDSSDEVVSESEPCAKVFSPTENRVCSLNSDSSRVEKEETELDSSTSRRVVVNSVYNDVNNLMEGSNEAGYVVTKSIMEVDGPATVCVDLNVHEMEPSPLTGGSKTVVNLDKELFILESDQKEKHSETQSDCQVNSSEDVSSNVVPLRQQGHASSCDNPRNGSPSSQASDVSDKTDLPSHENHQIAVRDNFDNSEHAGSRSEVDVRMDDPLSATSDEPSNAGLETISSSSNTDISNASEERTAECDSAVASNSAMLENSTEMPVSVSAENLSGSCDSGSGVTSRTCETEESDFKSAGDSEQSYDNVSSAPMSSDPLGYNEVIPQSVDQYESVSDSNNPRCDHTLPSEDANVDSTSSESASSKRFSCSQSSDHVDQNAQSNVTNFCDSNSERDISAGIVQENSVSLYDSSSEEVGVSSSSALQSQPHNTVVALWETEAVEREALPDNATSATSPSPAGSGCRSPGRVVSSNSSSHTANSTFESLVEACSSSFPHTTNANGSVNSGVVSSNTLSTPPPQSMASPLSSPPLLTSQDELMASNLVSTSSTSDQEVVPVGSSISPPTTTSEAVPAVKKKVSLLEYRMRLKKPVVTATETKTSSPISQPCTTVTLSSVCERFLSSSPSSTSTSSYSSSATSPHRKHRMPTLAPLPLFNSAEKKKEEKRPSKERKKVAKQLSLTERLRLEFGLDESVEDKTKSDPSAVDSSTSATKDETIPPPPPPPSRSYPYSSTSKTPSRPASSFSVSSSIPGVNFGGPMVNGGIGSSHHPQQSNISSTSVSSSHIRESNSCSYHPPPPPPPIPPSQVSNAISTYQPLPPQQQQQPQAPASISPSSSSSSSSSSTSHKPSGPAGQWPHQVSSPLFPPVVSPNSQPSSTSSLPTPSSHLPHQPHHTYDYYHLTPSQSQPVGSGNPILDDDPPPPPPPPLPRSHPHHTSSSSSSHRHSSLSHRRHDSSDRNKKAASSSSHLSDKRSRY